MMMNNKQTNKHMKNRVFNRVNIREYIMLSCAVDNEIKKMK